MHNCPQSPGIYSDGMMDIILKVNWDDPVPSGSTLTQVLESLLWLFSKPRTLTFSSQLTEERITLKVLLFFHLLHINHVHKYVIDL